MARHKHPKMPEGAGPPKARREGLSRPARELQERLFGQESARQLGQGRGKVDHVIGGIGVRDELMTRLDIPRKREGAPLEAEIRDHQWAIGAETEMRDWSRRITMGVHDARQGEFAGFADLSIMYSVPVLDALGNPIPGEWQLVDITTYHKDLAWTYILNKMIAKRAELDFVIRTWRWGFYLADEMGADTIREARELNGEDLSQPMEIPAWFA